MIIYNTRDNTATLEKRTKKQNLLFYKRRKHLYVNMFSLYFILQNFLDSEHNSINF